MSVAVLTEKIDKITKPFKTTIPVVIVDRASEIPGHANSTEVAGGATTQDRIYLIRNALTAGDADVTLFHEMLHFGLRRFLSKPEYIRQMQALYTKDAWVQQKADEWVAGSEGADLRKQDYPEYYIRARGVDEALASLAEIMQTNPSGYRNNDGMAKAKRAVREWIAKLGALVRNQAFARKWRAYAAQSEARGLVTSIFAKLEAGAERGLPSTRWENVHTSFRTASERSTNLNPTVAPNRGLRDTPMRLAFQKTGALAVWRGAFPLLEKTPGAALNNRVGEFIKAGLIDRYGLSDAAISGTKSREPSQRAQWRHVQHLRSLRQQARYE